MAVKEPVYKEEVRGLLETSLGHFLKQVVFVNESEGLSVWVEVNDDLLEALPIWIRFEKQALEGANTGAHHLVLEEVGHLRGAIVGAHEQRGICLQGGVVQLSEEAVGAVHVD